MEQRGGDVVPGLERGLRILEVVAGSKHGCTLTEISKTMGLPKSSTRCLLLTLHRCGYLQRNARTGRYMFGLKNLRLANEGLGCIELREQAMPHLRLLVERTHLTAHLMVLGFFEAVVIGKVEPPGLLRLATWIGKRMDLHCTGGGKALIAYFPETELDRLVKECGLPRHNDNTIRSIRRLRSELALVRRLGYAFDDEEDEIGLRCVGAPIFDALGAVAAALSVSGTTLQIHPENLKDLVAEVKKTALDISTLLGFGGGHANGGKNSPTPRVQASRLSVIESGAKQAN